MVAAERRQAVAAHNTANLTTDGISRQRLSSRERAGGGVDSRVDTVDLTDEGRNIAQTVDGAQNNVDASSEAVNQITARSQQAQNARTLRTQDEMLGTALDMLA